MVVVARAQSGQVRLDDAGSDRREVGDTGLGQRREVTLQIPAVRGEGVRGQAALDGEVVEVPADGTAQGRRGFDARTGPFDSGVGQPSTSASGSTGMPCASATGP